MKSYKLYLVLFVLLFALTAQAQTQTAYTRANLWQKEVDAFLAADKKEFPPKGAVLLYGSSSIRKWTDSAQAFAQFKTINRGFGGTHFEDANYYAKDIVLPYEPSLIVVYEGENDITAGKSVDQVFNDYKIFVALVHKTLPKTRIAVISLKPSPSREEFWDKFKQLNALIKADTEKDKRLTFVDIWDKMLTKDGKGREELYVEDRLHMKPAGYDIWREALTPVITKGIKGNFR